MKPDKERYDLAIENFEKAYKDKQSIPLTQLRNEYLAFSQFVQSIFIDSEDWVIDTGNYRDVNRILIHKIRQNIQRHPLLWKLFMYRR